MDDKLERKEEGRKNSPFVAALRIARPGHPRKSPSRIRARV